MQSYLFQLFTATGSLFSHQGRYWAEKCKASLTFWSTKREKNISLLGWCFKTTWNCAVQEVQDIFYCPVSRGSSWWSLSDRLSIQGGADVYLMPQQCKYIDHVLICCSVCTESTIVTVTAGGSSNTMGSWLHTSSQGVLEQLREKLELIISCCSKTIIKFSHKKAL